MNDNPFRRALFSEQNHLVPYNAFDYYTCRAVPKLQGYNKKKAWIYSFSKKWKYKLKGYEESFAASLISSHELKQYANFVSSQLAKSANIEPSDCLKYSWIIPPLILFAVALITLIWYSFVPNGLLIFFPCLALNLTVFYLLTCSRSLCSAYQSRGIRMASQYLPGVVGRTRHLLEARGIAVIAEGVELLFKPLNVSVQNFVQAQHFDQYRIAGPEPHLTRQLDFKENYFCVLAKETYDEGYANYKIGNYNNSFLRSLILYEELCNYVGLVKQEVELSVGPYPSLHKYILLSIFLTLGLFILGSIYLYKYLFAFWFFYAAIAYGFFEYYYRKAKMSTRSYKLKLVVRRTKQLLEEKGIKVTAAMNFIKFVPLLRLN